MIAGFEVGAVFKIINEASPALTRILRQVRELNAVIDKARENLATLGTGLGNIKLGAATEETAALAAEWKNVARNATSARLAIGNASSAALRAGGAGGAGIGGLPGGGRQRLGSWLGGGGHFGGGGGHIGGPGIGLPGGSHFRGGGLAMAGAATFGWGLDQAAKTQDYVWKLEDISGLPHDEITHSKFRNLLEDFQVKSGFGIDAAGEAALADIRQMQGVPGGGVDTLGEILSAGAVEARRKGSSLEELVESGIGLAHQFKAYSPPEIRNLMATFAAMSTADPRTLSSMKRASGYAVPYLSELGFDPSSVFVAGTALARAGVDSTRSGTWIRELSARAMSGKHLDSLYHLGLVDENGKPTFYTNGRPDEFKLIEQASRGLQKLSPEDRERFGRDALGAQGFGGAAVLGDPKVLEQMHQLDAIRKSSAFNERYNNFGKDYLDGSTLQDARVAMAEFNVTAGELARMTLPAVNVALGNFRSILEGIRSVLPGTDGKSAAIVGGSAITGAIAGAGAGAIYGAFGGPIGALGGAAIGAGIGGVGAIAEEYMRNNPGPIDRFGREAIITGNSAAQAADGMKALGDAIRGLPAQPGGVFPGGSSPAPIQLNLNVDGRALASATSTALANMYAYPLQAPGADGLTNPRSPDDNFPSK